jgi:hypothetical protein
MCTEICTSAEFYAKNGSDLDNRALAEKKKRIKQLGFGESRLHCPWRET